MAVGEVRSTRRRTAVALSMVMATAVGIVLVLVLVAGPEPYLALGYPDPGVVTSVGTFVVRFGFDIAAGVTAGALVFGVFFTAASPSGMLAAEGWAALRLGGRAAWVWMVCAIVMIPFDAANSIGEPVTRVLTVRGLVGVFGSLYAPPFWMTSALAAAVVAVGCHFVMRWRAAVALAAVAVVGLLPPVFVGHAASGASHDYSMNAVVMHVVAGGVWLGVLVALLVAARRGTDDLALAVRRYRGFAVVCWAVLAASGVLAAVLLVRRT